MSMKVTAAISVIVLTCSASASAQPPKRFMGGPVTLEDQGSFFVGGVAKVSEHASIPFAPPGQQPPAPTPQHAPLFPMAAVAEYYKQLVPNSESTLPGSTCGTCTPQALSPSNTWTPQNLATLVERLGGAVVATHSQSGIMGHHMVRILKERGSAQLVKGLITIEGGCSLPVSGLDAADFDAIPYLAVKGDYTPTSMQCQETVDAINARRSAGMGSAKAQYMKLDELGMLGVTHMMMLDANNLEIADLMIEWVGEHVEKAPRRR